MTPEDNVRYDREVYDAARDLAVTHRKNRRTMSAALMALGFTEDETIVVKQKQAAPDYWEDEYRGKMCDEGVIEALKEGLRRINGFKRNVL